MANQMFNYMEMHEYSLYSHFASYCCHVLGKNISYYIYSYLIFCLIK